MKISEKLQKQYWRRRVHPDSPERHEPVGTQYYVSPANMVGDMFDNYTQEDFSRENAPDAHDINGREMSLRPIYEPREVIDEDGNPKLDLDGKPITEWAVTGFDPVEIVSRGDQQRINTSKAAFMAGNGFWICHEEKEHELGDKLNSWKDSAGLDIAFMDIIKSCYTTADAAIYQYVQNGRIKFEVFSYSKGDILFPNYDENRNFELTRLYTLRGRRAVDIYSVDRIQTWIEGDEDNKKNETWLTKLSGWFAKGLKWDSAKMSEDGWRCLADNPTQTPKGINQCTYFRVSDIPSSAAEKNICALEKACSFVADGVKSTSQAILFVKATDIETLPRTDSTGKIIGVKGAVDELAAADAKFVAPPNLSDIATIDIANKKEAINQSTMSVNITPEIFRSADPSSAAIKLLFTDTIIWCKNNFTEIYPSLVDMVDTFKALVAKVEQDSRIYEMRTSCGCDFWIPQNDTEMLKRELDQVTYRVKSRKAAMSDIGNAHVEDYEQIMKEWNNELDMKARVPAEAKAEVEKKFSEKVDDVRVDNNDVPKPDNDIDNRAAGKSITE